jgi:hypothetical protein
MLWAIGRLPMRRTYRAPNAPFAREQARMMARQRGPALEKRRIKIDDDTARTRFADSRARAE